MNTRVTSPVLSEQAHERINELEMRAVFLEETVEALNQQLAKLTQEFALAKEALRHLHHKLEQVQPNDSAIKDLSEETPPPHY